LAHARAETSSRREFGFVFMSVISKKINQGKFLHVRIWSTF